jgi:hypothetical protein
MSGRTPSPMSGKDTGPHRGTTRGGTRALALLARATPTGPAVCASAAATAAAAIANPAAATRRGAIVLALLALTLGAFALAASEPASSSAPGSGSGRAGAAEPARPEQCAEVVMPRSSKHALLLCGLAFAGGCTAPMIERTTSATGSVAQLALLVGAAGSLTLTGLGLLHAAVARHTPAQVASPDPSGPAGHPSSTEVGWVGPPAGSLSTASLGRAWRRSYLALRTATTTPARAELATQRREYLDELAARDPAGFRRWITSDPYPVAGHPEHFIDPARSGSPQPPPHPPPSQRP